MSPLPSYSLAFHRDGTATYLGDSYSERKGRYTGRTDFDPLARWLQAQSTIVDKSESLPLVLDGGRVTLTLVFRDGRKIEKSWSVDPRRADLWAAAEVVDGVASQVQWKPQVSQ
jgi:hypothetical protein